MIPIKDNRSQVHSGPGVVAPDKGPIFGLKRTKRWLAFTVFMHLNCVFMLNWIV